jgi:hypothetical protein
MGYDVPEILLKQFTRSVSWSLTGDILGGFQDGAGESPEAGLIEIESEETFGCGYAHRIVHQLIADKGAEPAFPFFDLEKVNQTDHASAALSVGGVI